MVKMLEEAATATVREEDKPSTGRPARAEGRALLIGSFISDSSPGLVSVP